MKGLYLPNYEENTIYLIKNDDLSSIKQCLKEIFDIQRDDWLEIDKGRYRLYHSKDWEPFIIYDICGVVNGR